MKGLVSSIAIITILVVSGCAGNRNKPIIDPAGVDMGLYQKDLAECRQIAEQVEDKTGEGMAGGAVFGALIGAMLGDSDTVKRSAGVGAVSGGAKGAAKTRQEKERVVKNCLRYRGYQVLN